MLSRVLEVTFILIILYLVFTRARAFGEVTRSLGGVYIGAVKALQGRG